MFTKGKFTEIFILCVLNKSLTAFTTGNFSIGPVMTEPWLKYQVAQTLHTTLHTAPEVYDIYADNSVYTCKTQ